MLNAIFTDEFIDGVAQIYSERVLNELSESLIAIRSFKDLGTGFVRESLRKRYGDDIRKFPVSPFVIVYRYDENRNTVEFLALPHEKTVR